MTSHSQLNIVLLGGRNSGKSSVGNLLLGKEEFVTRERTSCTRRLGLVAGRRLTVVDAPGWWCDFSAQDTSELVKREMRRSVALCVPPGPHVFLLTVKKSSAFTEKRRRAVEEHVGLLGEQVWSHCVLLFTSSSSSCRATVRRSRPSAAEKEEEEALDWLRDKCGHRCHSVVLSDDDDDDANDDVTELLDKIHKLITENGNRVFEMEEKVLQAAVEEKRGVEERAQQRFMRVKQHRALMQERSRPVTSIRMVLLGAKGSGKTSALNTILGRDGAPPPGRTARCAVGDGVMFGRQLTVVDTPGWWMNYFSEDSTVFDQRELVLSLSLCPPGPHVFLLVIRVDRAFTETYGRAVREHLQLFGRHIWSRVLVLFSFGDWLGDTTTEQLIESEGQPLRTLLDRCGDRYHVLNNKTRGDGFQVRELIGKMEEMLTGGNSYHYYEIERNVMEQLEARMRGERERAKQRLMRKERWRQMAKSQLEKLRPLPELRLLLVGGSRTGKSSCGNTILSRDVFHTDTHTTSCAEARGSVSVNGGRVAVTVLDTPGGLAVTSDLLGDPASCALLLVVNVSCSFRDAHRQQLEKQLEAAAGGGDGQMWSRRALVLFSHGDWLGGDSGGVERRVESEGAALQRLVDRCGNRYHVLDNKRRGDDEAQAAELLELVQEMLAQERAADLHRGDRVWRNVSAASCEPTGSSSSLTQTSPLCSGGGAGGQIVAAGGGGGGGRAGRTGLTTVDRDAFLSFLSSLLPGNSGLRWTAAGQQSCVSVALPGWFTPHHGSPRLNGESRTHPTMVLVLPQTRSRRMLAEENGVNVQTLCHPALRDRTLRRLGEQGGLQQLLERWGDSSLEELEAFIDAYFEMVWEQTMGSFQEAEPEPEPEPPASEQDAGREEEEEEEVLTSIDRKLSKLDLLEEIRSELSELRESLEHSWTTVQELRDKSQQEPRNTC